MGWASCGEDGQGRPIGYAHVAVCDEPGCDTRIDRGLAYACGGMHGDDVYHCEKYFCAEHLVVCPKAGEFVCQSCEASNSAEDDDDEDLEEDD